MTSICDFRQFRIATECELFSCLPICSVPVVLVGNKTDLHQERAVSYEEGKKLAESWRATFLETSAKQNEVSGINHCLPENWSLHRVDRDRLHSSQRLSAPGNPTIITTFFFFFRTSGQMSVVCCRYIPFHCDASWTGKWKYTGEE